MSWYYIAPGKLTQNAYTENGMDAAQAVLPKPSTEEAQLKVRTR